MLRGDVQPLIEARCDVLVLGCTHFPFLAPALRDLVGPDIHLLDTGPAVARQAARVLGDAAALNPASGPGPTLWRCSGSDHDFQQQRRLLGFAAT